jgi:2-polyprenyl-3-methyl-5-hydroxy-6-metoxy-1,4-benzoquinol methylase
MKRESSALSQLLPLYWGSGYGVLYAFLRWFMCPYREMERLLPAEGMILDVGCGEGVFSNFLAIASPARKVIGVEISERRLAVASVTARKGSLVQFVQADVRQLHFKGLKAVVMSDFLHHLPFPDQDMLLRWSWGLLSVPGVLLIKEITKDDEWRYHLSRSYDRILYPREAVYFSNSDDLATFLSKLGFAVTVKKSAQHLPGSTNLFLCRKETEKTWEGQR